MRATNLPNQTPGVSRRRFLRVAGMASASLCGLVHPSVLGRGGAVAPNSRTTLAGIGTGGQGMQNLEAFLEFPEVQVVAVCDVHREGGRYLSWNWSQGKEDRVCGRDPARCLVDDAYAEQRSAGQRHSCHSYADYRELLEEEDVDAVMVATPDHTHAVITLAALKRRKHVYCEKPLTYSVEEARRVTEAAREAGVATQLGNQGQAEEKDRRIRELIGAGVIGEVREVRVWTPARFWSWPGWEGRPPEQLPIPEGLDWDLWLGPAPERPYHPAYHPWTWRNWRDFGTGLLGDLGCHKLSTVFKALDLGHPTRVEGSCTKLSEETYPLGEIVRYEFPERESRPPVTLSWHDGGLRPPRPPELEHDDPLRDVAYLGDGGTIMGDRLVPETRMAGYRRPPEILPRSPGHYHEFVAACRGGARAGSDFVEHSGLLTEVCLLGNVAVRAQRQLLWDGPNLRITNDSKANRWLGREYRSGWAL